LYLHEIVQNLNVFLGRHVIVLFGHELADKLLDGSHGFRCFLGNSDSDGTDETGNGILHVELAITEKKLMFRE
jgi:hypothetical protein